MDQNKRTKKIVDIYIYMLKIRAIFEYVLPNQNKILIITTASNVTPYEVEDLTLQFLDEDGNPFEMTYDINIFKELEELAINQLQEVKSCPELDFNDMNKFNIIC